MKSTSLHLKSAIPIPIPTSTLSTFDSVRRCWGESFVVSSPAMVHYHDTEWGRATIDSRSLFRQLILQTFQCGLSWSTILTKFATFEKRFVNYDYQIISKWTENDILAALSDPGIIRNRAKILAAVNNAQIACELDAASPSGFAAFCYRHCFCLPHVERLLQLGSRSGSHMRNGERTDFLEADGVHPTVGIQAACKAFRIAGFKFLGPCAMLSFMQAIGAVNHHAPDCAAFLPSEVAYKEVVEKAAAASWNIDTSIQPIILTKKVSLATSKRLRDATVKGIIVEAKTTRDLQAESTHLDSFSKKKARISKKG